MIITVFTRLNMHFFQSLLMGSCLISPFFVGAMTVQENTIYSNVEKACDNRAVVKACSDFMFKLIDKQFKSKNEFDRESILGFYIDLVEHEAARAAEQFTKDSGCQACITQERLITHALRNNFDELLGRAICKNILMDAVYDICKDPSFLVSKNIQGLVNLINACAEIENASYDTQSRYLAQEGLQHKFIPYLFQGRPGGVQKQNKNDSSYDEFTKEQLEEKLLLNFPSNR